MSPLSIENLKISGTGKAASKESISKRTAMMCTISQKNGKYLGHWFSYMAIFCKKFYLFALTLDFSVAALHTFFCSKKLPQKMCLHSVIFSTNLRFRNYTDVVSAICCHFDDMPL